MLSQRLEAAVLLPKRGDEVLLEEVSAGGEGDGVGDGVAQTVRVRLDEVDGLEDGGGGGRVEELDEGFDGGDGLGEVWVGGEEVSICCYDAGRTELGEVYVVGGGGERTRNLFVLGGLWWPVSRRIIAAEQLLLGMSVEPLKGLNEYDKYY